MNLLRQILDYLFGSNSKFDIGDGVELKGGSQIMMVTGISMGPTGEPIIYCEWCEKEGARKIVQSFFENELKFME